MDTHFLDFFMFFTIALLNITCLNRLIECVAKIIKAVSKLALMDCSGLNNN
jgi:hypothetical protein